MSVVLGLYFKDTAGLIKLTQKERSYKIDYDESLSATNPDAKAVHIGAGLELEDIKFILIETLKRYQHICYYKISSDYFDVPTRFHYRFVIGDDMETMERLKISPIDSDTMLGAAQNAKVKEELFGFIRSHYAEQNFKTWEVYKEELPAPEPSENETISIPAGINKKLKVMEFADKSKDPLQYALGINLRVETVDEFLNLLSDIHVVYLYWISQRQDSIAFFQLIVQTDPALHQEIDQTIKRTYEEKGEFGIALHATDFDFRIEDNDGNTSTKYILKGVKPKAHSVLYRFAKAWSKWRARRG